MKSAVVLLALVLLPSAFAANSLLTIPETVTVDFTNERAFTLQFPGGSERQFTWNSNETHSDVTFDHLIYFPFTEENYCNNTVQFAETYKNMTNTLSGLMGLCGGGLAHLNTTVNATENLTNGILAAQRDRDEYLRRYLIAETKVSLAQNATESAENQTALARADCTTARSERDAYKSQYDSCASSLAGARQTTTTTTNCDAEVRRVEESKNTAMIVAGLIGLGAGFFFGKRQGRGGGPSEMREAGHALDRGVYGRSEPMPE